MTQHTVGTREEWLAARIALLAEEKELTRRSDELSQKRQALPWVPVEKDYTFETHDGKKLAELFKWVLAAARLPLHVRPDGRGLAGGGLYGLLVHRGQPRRRRRPSPAARRDVRRSVSRSAREPGGLQEPDGLELPVGLCSGSDFNLDFAVFTEEGRQTGTGFNFGTPKHAAEIDLRRDELHGLSAFALEDGIV